MSGEIDKWLTITPQDITVGVLTADRSVAMQLRIHPEHLHLAPAVVGRTSDDSR
jgi:hypothetical protein